MRLLGLEPGVVSFNAAISACEAGRQWEWALELVLDSTEKDPSCFISVVRRCIRCLRASKHALACMKERSGLAMRRMRRMLAPATQEFHSYLKLIRSYLTPI